MNEIERAGKNFGVFDHVPIGVLVLRKDFVVLFWNSCLENWTGLSRDKIVGTPVGDHFAHLNSPKYSMRLRDIFSGGPPTIFSSQLHKYVIPAPAQDGQLRFQHVTVTPVRVPEGGDFYALLTIEDVTDLTRRIQDYKSACDKAMKEVDARKSAEEDLKKAREELDLQKKREEAMVMAKKLESVGVLAGGIAHDFNNLLTAIMGNVSLIKMFAEPGAEIEERLTEVEKATTRARDLTRQLLTFSSGSVPVKRVSDVGRLIGDAAVCAIGNSTIKSEISIPEDLWHAEIDEGQIRQVINNLVVNACEAMPGGGTVHVHAENVLIKPEDILPLSVGKYIRIFIKDEGAGIPEEHLARIFDPYFTTKENGSGLGLATAYSIIKNHDGFITVESHKDTGTAFYIYLHASEDREVVVTRTVEKPVDGRGKVLVMDDEEMIRIVAGNILTKIGYAVDYAADGEEAVALYKNAKESGSPFDIVILDLSVPGGMGGRETVKKLIEVDSGVKAIVSSGYLNDSIISGYRDYGFKGIVMKPYTIKEISEALYSVLLDEINNSDS